MILHKACLKLIEGTSSGELAGGACSRRLLACLDLGTCDWIVLPALALPVTKILSTVIIDWSYVVGLCGFCKRVASLHAALRLEPFVWTRIRPRFFTTFDRVVLGVLNS